MKKLKNRNAMSLLFVRFVLNFTFFFVAIWPGSSPLEAACRLTFK